jgi:hypothetical protein
MVYTFMLSFVSSQGYCARSSVGSIRAYTSTIVFIILCFMLLVKQGFAK